ncbi:phosphoenolpyruvate synthase [Pseudomaricurvus alkylphenolicus]|uniref:phosphoenolpyruvate synthase n=1 Tax=Pseudomaricurvus alkylphenolicus TaxID=1306991 RepID=UPI0014219860|nr:phosphoenolpyruvate synthase [Pseudomaricurvus alkylphenolicus]NIB41196.1 phosphoenolpyruvate synthase [Pseudomaricurvus alkylphenolicus]
MTDPAYVISLAQVRLADRPQVGDKNAWLGEMMEALSGGGVSVPDGFVVTVHSFREFLASNDLNEDLFEVLETVDVSDPDALARVSVEFRDRIAKAPFSHSFVQQVCQAVEALETRSPECSFSVRASLYGSPVSQLESKLNVHGGEGVIDAIKSLYVALFSERSISYRAYQGNSHREVSLAVTVQAMVRSDLSISGVMSTLDCQTGFDQVVLLNATYGLGEAVTKGMVNPDELCLYKTALEQGKSPVLRRKLGSKTQRLIYASDGSGVEAQPVDDEDARLFSLTDGEAEALGKLALCIEKYFGTPVDVEWAKDGLTEKLYILQANPARVETRAQSYERYQLKGGSSVLAQGRSIGQRIGSGVVRIVARTEDISSLRDGEVLVADHTDPDWEPAIKRASAIVTNRGGRTCHAAIIAREFGIPAVVGCGDATELLSTGQLVTVSCAEGDTGYVYDGQLPYEVERRNIGSMPDLPFQLMLNVGNPDRAFDFQRLPHAGVGLARLEFIINRMVGVHPNALLQYSSMPPSIRAQIDRQMAGYASPVEFFVQKLAEGIAMLAAAFAPHKVVVRLSDFKSNEYAHLIGGDQFEPLEENPMLGFRGSARFTSRSFAESFALECRAIKWVREEIGLTNVEIMVPFVRTLAEAQQVNDVLADNGLVRGEQGLRVIMMCELPANALMADEFLHYFDGFSIGSNDLTQLTLGLDRDSGLVAQQFDERNPAVKKLLQMAIGSCKKAGKYVGICGQGPSDHLDFAVWLMEQGIDSISLNPDSLVETWLHLSHVSNNA